MLNSMHSERIISRMMVSINCLLLGKKSFDDTFVVNVANDSDICGSLININNLKISDLKFLIWNQMEDTLRINNSDIMDLWKVDIAYNDENKLKDVTTEDDIKKELGGKKLVPTLLVKNLFLEQSLVDENIHVIVQLPAAAGPSQQGVSQGPNWNDASSVYEWIKQFKLNRGRNRLVNTYGKDFTFLQRDETINALWKGTRLAGIAARFKNRNVNDKGFHPIPVLAGGPGVGKSRFLDEVERLLGQCANESDDEEIREAFTNMIVINTSYGNGSPAKIMDVQCGAEASLAIRILFEYFRPTHDHGNGYFDFSLFQSYCNNYPNISSFTLSTALRIVYADVIIQKNQEIYSNPPLVLVLGIDELNKLHDTEKGACKELIKAIGGVMCQSPTNIYFIPILAGTIEGPLNDYISGSMHEQLPLPLRLLNDEDAIRIGVNMNLFSYEYSLRSYFRISISDIGGHLGTLEYYYEYFSQEKEKMLEKMSSEAMSEEIVHNVDITKIMEFVKDRIINNYQLELNSRWLTITLAKAILGFPVKKKDTIMLNEISMTYQELSSMGVVNLVPTEEPGKYLIRLPYVWVCAIVENSDDPRMMYWKSMLKYDEPINCKNFEDFNAKFWALRLCLFRLIGYKQIKLKTLFKGADLSLSFPDVEVDLPEVKDIKLYNILHRYLDYRTYENQVKYADIMAITEVRNSYTGLDLLKNDNIMRYTGCVFFNTLGLSSEPLEFLDDKSSEFKICIMNQDRLITPFKNVTQEFYDEEYKKITKTMNEVGMKDWIFLCLTSASKEEYHLDKPNSALVYMENFQKFYGYTYASRAQFASANKKYVSVLHLLSIS